MRCVRFFFLFWEHCLLFHLIDWASLIVSRVFSTTVCTNRLCINFFFTIFGQMVSSTFDTSDFFCTVVFGMSQLLAPGTLRDVKCFPWCFNDYFGVKKFFDFKYFFIMFCRFNLYSVERELTIGVPIISFDSLP